MRRASAQAMTLVELIVAIAIMFDRVSQAFARRTQRHLKGQMKSWGDEG